MLCLLQAAMTIAAMDELDEQLDYAILSIQADGVF